MKNYYILILLFTSFFSYSQKLIHAAKLDLSLEDRVSDYHYNKIRNKNSNLFYNDMKASGFTNQLMFCESGLNMKEDLFLEDEDLLCRDISIYEGWLKRLDKRDFEGYIDYFKTIILEDIFHSRYQQYYKFTTEKSIDNQITLASLLEFPEDYFDINFEFVTGDTERMIARAHSPVEGDVRIIINIDKWEQINNYERMWLLTHEWAHEVFNMKHGQNDLMYPLLPSELKLTKVPNLNKHTFTTYSKEKLFNYIENLKNWTPNQGTYTRDNYIKVIEQNYNVTLDENFKPTNLITFLDNKTYVSQAYDLLVESILDMLYQVTKTPENHFLVFYYDIYNTSIISELDSLKILASTVDLNSTKGKKTLRLIEVMEEIINMNEYDKRLSYITKVFYSSNKKGGIYLWD